MDITALNLFEKRKELQEQLDDLAGKTNSSLGSQQGIWDCMSSLQKQIRDIDEKMKSIDVDKGVIKRCETMQDS